LSQLTFRYIYIAFFMCPLNDEKDSSSARLKSFYFHILLFSIAFIPRLIYLLTIKDNPFFNLPIIDCQTYDELAQNIAKGNWIGDKAFWQAPLYPYFLGMVYSIFGHDLFLARFIQILLGSVNCLLLFRIVKSVFSSKIAWIVFLIASFYGPFLFFDAELLNPVLIIFLNLCLVLTLFSFLSSPNKTKLFLAGIILGLSSITHGLVIVFLPFALLWIVTLLLKNKWATGKILHYSIFLVFGFLLVISTTAIRNWLVGKDLVWISSNSGINFFIGNNPDYEKTVSIRPGIEWEELIARPIQHGFQTPSKRSSFFWREAFSYVTGQPFSYLNLLLKKFLLILNGYEIKRNQDMYLFRDYSFVLRLLLWKWLIYFPFGVLLPLSLTGIIIFWWDRSKSKTKGPKPLLILYFILSQILALLFFFICDRYRIPLVPFLIIFAGFGLYRLYEMVKTKASKNLLIFLSIFFVFLFISNVRRHKPTVKDQAEEHYNLGMVYGREQKFDQAIREYNQALAFQPDHLMAHFNIAFLYQQENKIEEAEEKYQEVIKLLPQAALAYNNLGLIYEQKGDQLKAEELYAQASRFHPLLPDPLYNLGNIYAKEGKYPQAMEKFDSCLKVDPTYYKAYNGMGDLYYRSGETDRAIAFFQKAIKIQPDYEVAHNNLGTAYIKKGLRQKAFSEFEEAIKINPHYGPAYVNIGNYYLEQEQVQKAIAEYQHALNLTPNDSRVHYHLAVAYLMSGSKENAMAELNQALSCDSSFVQAKELLERIQKQ
jgi:tetratricopeptide (TPR) repeat protein